VRERVGEGEGERERERERERDREGVGAREGVRGEIRSSGVGKIGAVNKMRI
jgi:hypothetical protein